MFHNDRTRARNHPADDRRMSTDDAAHVARDPLRAYADASDARFVDAASGKRLSGCAFVRLVRAARRALVASAATIEAVKGRGDDDFVVVAIGCDVGVEFVAYFLAACALGWTPAPLNSRWSASEARDACASVSAAMVVLDASHVARWGDDASASAVFEGLTVLDASAVWEEETPGEEDEWLGALKRRADGACSFCFTSGTTGKPKAVMLTHEGVCAASRAKHEVVGYERGDTYLHCAPLFHVGGLSSAHASLAVGSKHVFMPKFDVKDALRLINEERVTAFIAVPTMMAMMMREVKENPDAAVSGTSVKRILVGAGRLMDGQLEAIRSVFPNAVVTLAYGMSETSSSITFLRPDDPRLEGDPMFAGDAVRDVEIKTNADGELLVRGPIVMLGYHGVDRQDTFDAEGWFATGDLGKVAESESPESETGARVWLYGRVKDIIKTGGENVVPHEVESVLNSHPDVETSAVAGVPDPTWGETVVAFVQRKASARGGETCEAKSIVDHCVDANLARFKVPKRIVFVDSISLNAMGKVSRSALLETYARELETPTL